MPIDIDQAAQLVGQDIGMGGYSIPQDVFNSIYSYAKNAGHVSDPFRAGDSCWKLATYLGICACESAFVNQCGDPYASAADAPCDLTQPVCSSPWGMMTKFQMAWLHAPYGGWGAYLSHGWFQLFVCGQGADYACDPARLHELGLHMSIALYWIAGAINSVWSDSDIELSVRKVSRASGHPGWSDLYHPSYTNIWNATRAIQPDLYAFLLGNVPPSPGLKVTLYEHTGYGVPSVEFYSDNPDFTKIGFNDKASSIKIEGSVGVPSVHLYQDTMYGGASIKFTESHPNFNALPMTDTLSWNDQASAIRLTAPAPPPPPPFPPSPLPAFPVPKQTLGPSPLPPLPSSGGSGQSPLPPLP